MLRLGLASGKKISILRAIFKSLGLKKIDHQISILVGIYGTLRCHGGVKKMVFTSVKQTFSLRASLEQKRSRAVENFWPFTEKGLD